mgnify:CR=1 FL=1
MKIINKERIIKEQEIANVVIMKRGKDMDLCSSHHESYTKDNINNLNNNIRKGVQHAN